MGSTGTAIIDSLDPTDLANELDRLHAYELVTALWCRAVENRLAGPALYFLPDELREEAATALERARRLADRIAQLGGAVRAHPAQLLARARLDAFELPADPSDIGSVVRLALAYQRFGIEGYAELLQRVAGHDAVSAKLLTDILTHAVAREDGMESSLAATSRVPSTASMRQ
jgi:ferritin-like protein